LLNRVESDDLDLVITAVNIQREVGGNLAEILDVVPANFNTPSQTVLSGATGEIERSEKVFAAAGVRTLRFPVAAAFHSAFVAEAAKPFREALNSVALPQGSVPVYANTTGKVYPLDPELAVASLGLAALLDGSAESFARGALRGHAGRSSEFHVWSRLRGAGSLPGRSRSAGRSGRRDGRRDASWRMF